MIGTTWKETLANIVFTALVAIIAILAYHAWRTHTSPRYVIVNVNAIVRAKEEVNAALLQKSGISDIEKRKIIDGMATFGLQLNEAIQQASTECRCVILNHAAVLGGTLDDLTPDVERRLGM